MTHFLSALCRGRQVNAWIYESVRFAGHSKWANIKHGKALQDAKRDMLFSRLRRAMAHAIREGGSPNPAENIKLSRVLEQAKLANMPLATMQRYMQKITADKSNMPLYKVEIIGSGGYTMVVSYTTDNNHRTLNEFRGKAKRFGAKVMETRSKSTFEHIFVIYAEKACTYDQAEEDAIVANAEEVEEIDEQGTKYFQFRTNAEEGPKVVTRLKSLGYSISSTDESHVPLSYVQLDEDDMKLVTGLEKKLREFENVEKIETNIDYGES